jgi:hypothetical protein
MTEAVGKCRRLASKTRVFDPADFKFVSPI